MKRLIILTSSIALFICVYGCNDDNPVSPNNGFGHSISMNRADWKLSSFPAQLDPNSVIRGTKILWHSFRYAIPVSDVYDKETAPGEGTIRPFRIISRPDSVRLDSLFDH